MSGQTEDRAVVQFIHRTPLFEQCLRDLFSQGGTAALAARRVERIICTLAQQGRSHSRERFGITRKGEYRIDNCKKIALGHGYRLICILKDFHLVLLFVGSHDACFRWIERHRGFKYSTTDLTDAVPAECCTDNNKSDLPQDVIEECKFVEAYEAELMSRISDDMLYKIFPDLCRGQESPQKRLF
ncbi:MAG TPA: hypothetical protein VK452_03090 [Dissulfurispiraceae bacterium]|nr:hypothetical protein [Dissulfurispiraceae bacterium]